jgi:hypothetical protein
MNRLSERFERKIPTFLAHLDVWNDTPMSDCKYTTHDYKRAMRNQKYTKKCVICGKTFTCKNYNKRQLCCSRSCGSKLGSVKRIKKIAKRKAVIKGV